MIDEYFYECGLCHVVMSEAAGHRADMDKSPYYDGDHVVSDGKRYGWVIEATCPGCGEENFPMRIVQHW